MFINNFLETPLKLASSNSGSSLTKVFTSFSATSPKYLLPGTEAVKNSYVPAFRSTRSSNTYMINSPITFIFFRDYLSQLGEVFNLNSSIIFPKNVTYESIANDL